MGIFFITGISSVGFACHALDCQLQRYNHLNPIGINWSDINLSREMGKKAPQNPGFTPGILCLEKQHVQ